MTSTQTKLKEYTSNSNNNDIIQLKNNKELNKFSKLIKIKEVPQSFNLNKSHLIPSKKIKIKKLSINSSLNPPSLNTDKNISFNDQFFQQNGNSLKDEDENESKFNEYIIIKNKRNQTIDKIKNINIRIKINKLKIGEIKKKLTNLREEKKQKEADIVNLLSNKESIEEIYTNQIYLLTNHLCGSPNNNIFNENNILNNDINNLTNISIKNDMNDNSTINLNSMHNITIADNEILINDEGNFKISLNEIKESDQNIYNKQVKNMFEQLFKIKDEKINSSIDNIINNSYKLYINKNTEENGNENNEVVVYNFITKISLFIFNHSFGKYSESKINLILKYLMKINSINVKLSKYIKFVNKIYKEEKKNLNGMINFLEKKSINLIDKKHRLENIIKVYDEKLELFEKKTIFETEPNYEGDDTLELKEIKNIKSNDETHILSNEISNKNLNKVIKIKNKKPNNTCFLNTNENIRRENENLEKNNNDELNNDIMTYYGDAFDQNKENDSEENDLSDKYITKLSEINKQMINKNKKFLNNYNEDNTKRSDSSLAIKRNSKNKIKIMHINTLNQSINLRNKTNNSLQIGSKIIESNFNNTSTNIVDDNRIVPFNQNLTKNDEKERENKMTSIELEHYIRVQRIMNASPNVSNYFGVNNYNPKNHTYKSITPNINLENFPNSNNKIDKTIRYGGRKNHNFISIINMTQTIPIKDDNEIEQTEIKEKPIRKIREVGNDSSIKIINLEKNILNEINKTENDNKINESTSITRSNNVKSNTITKLANFSHGSKNLDNYNNLIINGNNDNDDNIDVFTKINDDKNINKEINKEQKIFTTIINSKKVDKEKSKSSIKGMNDKDENKEYINNKKEINDLFNNTHNIKTLKITKSRQLNINDIKNNNLSLMRKKNIRQKLFGKKEDKAKEKLIHTNIKDNKEVALLNKNKLRIKPTYISSDKTKICTKKISSNFISQKMSENNSFVNINDKSINRSISLIEYQPQENSQEYNIKKVNTSININESLNKSFNNNDKSK